MYFKLFSIDRGYSCPDCRTVYQPSNLKKVYLCIRNENEDILSDEQLRKQNKSLLRDLTKKQHIIEMIEDINHHNMHKIANLQHELSMQKYSNTQIQLKYNETKEKLHKAEKTIKTLSEKCNKEMAAKNLCMEILNKMEAGKKSERDLKVKKSKDSPKRLQNESDHRMKLRSGRKI